MVESYRPSTISPSTGSQFFFDSKEVQRKASSIGTTGGTLLWAWPPYCSDDYSLGKKLERKSDNSYSPGWFKW